MLHLLRQLPRDWREKIGPVAERNDVPWNLRHSSSVETSTGRGAIMHLLQLLGLGSNDAVLMPAYIAEGVIRPFRQQGVRVLFYKLTPELQPDEPDIERLLSGDSRVRIVVIVHPLGREAHFERLRSLAADRSIYVLEDCAHALFSEYGTGGQVGTRGDFTLFSLNKFLPVPDGAVLLSARDDVDVAIPSHVIPPTDRPAIDHYLEHLYLNAELLDSTERDASMSLLQRTGAAYDRYYERINTTPRATATSEESLFIRARYDLAGTRARRRANAARLYDAFPEGPIRLMYPDRAPGVTWFAVPALVPGGRRASVVAAAIERGVLFSTLIDRWNFVPDREGDRFQIERDYMTNHILIPVSEFLDDAAMDRIIAVLAEIQRGLGRA
jgi:dTDP-4-amino-4,6-dideoxygalactose transaminase